MTLEEVLELRHRHKLVFTNGVFDILHAGHVKYLQEAKGLGEILIVGLNSDTSVKALNKGANRPVNSQEDRAAVLQALRAVDGVVIFDDATPERLIRAIRPEVHVKGGDYKADDLPEAAAVREFGGEVVILPLLEGRSTTTILKRLETE